jgi:orotidine-5'-phosphate decarboxylase
MSSFTRQSYAQRSQNVANPSAKMLLEIMDRKKSNLCVSVDVTKKDDFLRIIDVVGPYVSLIKATAVQNVLDIFSLTVTWN